MHVGWWQDGNTAGWLTFTINDDHDYFWEFRDNYIRWTQYTNQNYLNNVWAVHHVDRHSDGFPVWE